MKTWQTSGGIKIYSLIDSFTNIYLVRHAHHSILVDSARHYRYKVAKSRLEKILEGEKLNYLFLTHTHYDHAENAFRFKQDFNCKIIADEREKQFLEKGRSPLPKGTNTLAKIVVFLGNHFTNIEKYNPAKVDIPVDDIYELKTTNEVVRIIRTPGHSPGSVSLILENEIAIVGDAMFHVFENSIFPPFASDISELINSWEKLLKTDCTLFLPGHGKEVPREMLERELEKRKG
ncbi:MAG: MBL fold metallo-hydrolase [Bacteroidales bacterium]|nr:MBL fold metallo-hydrolase [Bacteroidales bacterium]MCF8392075.1 MBL fold metallo-hydrolase [Bacteroidales bacterium]